MVQFAGAAVVLANGAAAGHNRHREGHLRHWTGEKLQVIIDEWDMNPEAEAIDVGDIDAADLNEHEGDLENES